MRMLGEGSAPPPPPPSPYVSKCSADSERYFHPLQKIPILCSTVTLQVQKKKKKTFSLSRHVEYKLGVSQKDIDFILILTDIFELCTE